MSNLTKFLHGNLNPPIQSAYDTGAGVIEAGQTYDQVPTVDGVPQSGGDCVTASIGTQRYKLGSGGYTGLSNTTT